MKLLIIGGTGFIGKPLIAKLVGLGHEVTALVRNPAKAEDLPCRGVQWPHQDSYFNTNQLQDLMAQTDAVINLAGEPIAQKRWNETTQKRVLESRIRITHLLVQTIGKLPSHQRPLALLNASAIGYYGDCGDQQLTERSQKGTDYLANVCASWEQEALAAEAYGVRVVCLRTGIVLGRNGGALSQMLPIQLGSGRQWMSWIHMDDALGIIVHALNQTSISGPIHLVAPNPSRNADFTRELGNAYGVPFVAAIKAPKCGLRLALGNELAGVILTGQRVSASKVLGSGYVFQFPTLKEALIQLIDGDQEFITWQKIDRPISDIFEFFSQERNLETLTPSWLNFRIVHVTHPSSMGMSAGTLIDYRLKIHHIPFSWKTRIENWVAGEQFTDIQLKGPYAKWHHTHTFKAIGHSTLITDQIRYRLPLKWLGRFFAGSYVRSKIETIFKYRKQKINQIF